MLRDDDRGEYAPTLTIGQRWLWECYQEDIAAVAALAGKAHIDLLHLGDIIQGLQYFDGLSVTRFADQIAIGKANVVPWDSIKGLKRRYIVSGTAAHDCEGAAGELVASLWGAEPLDHGLLDVGGVLIDAAHHGPAAGIREWTRGNIARLYLLDRMMTDDPPARVYLRAHRHDYIRETVTRRGITADIIISPSYQLPGAYARQVAQSPSAAVCGMVALVIDGGRLADVVSMTHKVDLRRRVTI